MGGVLTSAPRLFQKAYDNLVASLPISPEPGRTQIFLTEDGSAAAVSLQATGRVSRQIFQSPRTHNGSRLVHTGKCRQTRPRGRTCSSPGQTAPRARPRNNSWMLL